ncbi:hypothetical protein A1O3_03923 [Capronia epimyces CBS 606.96]|uniref:Uncharacterized protein n=1 Tax=Capronia epimyces CBS 606.96 TaxID=1182542 RepID=W9YXE7_9EURO|nr:uncharacterized protein A1O3_03923 [Capronia epimyces CBS 606.96]EXJ86969.1 hypothetical protein A1O3_03923 [Capronia epimyces CBS 606.96]
MPPEEDDWGREAKQVKLPSQRSLTIQEHVNLGFCHENLAFGPWSFQPAACTYMWRCQNEIQYGVVYLPLGSATAAQAEQIFTFDAFSRQKTSVQYCFTTSLSGCTMNVVGSAIGCAIGTCSKSFGALDDCLALSNNSAGPE